MLRVYAVLCARIARENDRSLTSHADFRRFFVPRIQFSWVVKFAVKLSQT